MIRNAITKVKEYINFLIEAFGELAKIHYPTRQAVIYYTIAIIVIAGFIAGVLAIFDIMIVTCLKWIFAAYIQ